LPGDSVPPPDPVIIRCFTPYETEIVLLFPPETRTPSSRATRIRPDIAHGPRT
jgi:hypothetical protein